MTWVAWGKLTRDDNGQVVATLDLASHCLDVAAVVQALLDLPVPRRRLEHLAGRELSARDACRLVVLAFLHDIGKASRGFQSKWFAGIDRRDWLGNISFGECGHTREVGPLFQDDQLTARFEKVFPVDAICSWHAQDGLKLWLASISHHGTPINSEALRAEPRETWKPNAQYDPMDTLRELGEIAQSTWPDAFVEDGIPLPEAPAFVHAFAGLVSLADWIGSDTRESAFPYDLAAKCDRWEASLSRAREVLRDKRVDLRELQGRLREMHPAFDAVFPFAPSDMQEAMADLALGPLVVVEAETGSGKTEAALWRFKTLFEAGEVDALAFVLPTRVSAVQIEERIRRFMSDLFPGASNAPNVVLALPGYLRVDGVDARERLPGFKVLWPDNEDERLAHLRWAAENSKRYLAASCAVGTIDQVLLSGLQARHAHLRGFSLLRSLLVVDEVHASDCYMTGVLQLVLRRHLSAGGHALLLSATLGVAARDSLLAMGQRTEPRDTGIRLSNPYPAITDQLVGSREIRNRGRTKNVRVLLRPWIKNPQAIAAQAADAVSRGARVLIVRNTVNGVIEVQRALEAVLGEGHPALFRCEGVVCPHHGRFAAADRRVLDKSVERLFGKQSPMDARVLCGSQTLEQSLDIDADLIITDLAPMDVLLQRLGRLHRHAERERPDDFAEPSVIVLTPPERDLSTALTRRHGGHGIGSVYSNVIAIEATWKALESRETLSIPEDNRALVEQCTDPLTLMALADGLGDVWATHWRRIEGEARAQGSEAVLLGLDWNSDWESVNFPAMGEERVRTRLGTSALRVCFAQTPTSPFRQKLEEIAVPGWMLQDRVEQHALTVNSTNIAGDCLLFSVGEHVLTYSRVGLSTKTQELK